jgi:hypothetical protein
MKRPSWGPEPEARQGCYPSEGKEEFMSIIRARRDDWIPENPRIRVSLWIGAAVAAAVLYVAVAAIIGHLLNGNGSPYLLSL